MSRHDTTTEELGVELNYIVGSPFNAINPSEEDFELALKLVKGGAKGALTKWMTGEAIKDYTSSICNGWGLARHTLAEDPHSRRIVINGPHGACWVSTQYLSHTDGTYRAISYYRSMDSSHAAFDVALQWLLAQSITNNKTTRLQIFAGSYHTYL